MHARSLVCTPLPHVRVQSDHSPQSDHAPWTGGGPSLPYRTHRPSRHHCQHTEHLCQCTSLSTHRTPVSVYTIVNTQDTSVNMMSAHITHVLTYITVNTQHTCVKMMSTYTTVNTQKNCQHTRVSRVHPCRTVVNTQHINVNTHHCQHTAHQCQHTPLSTNTQQTSDNTQHTGVYIYIYGLSLIHI